MLKNLVSAFDIFILYYVVILSIWQIVQLLGTLSVIYSNRRKNNLFAFDNFRKDPELIPISIIAPAYNEGAIIVESVKGMLNLNYPFYEVIVVNDGSTDDSLEKLIKEFKVRKVNYPMQIQIPCANIRGIYKNPKIPHLTVVDKENGGCKSDACNAGINISSYPYFINMDSDCLLDDDALSWISRSFMSDKNCIAVGGMMRISNGNDIKDHKITNFHMPKNWLARSQVLEYSRSFLVGRAFASKLKSLLVISGAFGAFNKNYVLEVGGYSIDSIGEDMDLVMKLHCYMRENKLPYNILFSPKAICWTQAPENFKELGGQRRRWHIGLIQVIQKFKHLIFNLRYGTVGMIGMPYQFFYELCGPVIEALGVFAMALSLYYGIITTRGLVLFCTAGYLLSVLISIGSLTVEVGIFNRKIERKDFRLLIFLSFTEVFLFRLLNVLFRLQGTFGYKRFKNSWGHITRQSFKDKKST